MSRRKLRWKKQYNLNYGDAGDAINFLEKSLENAEKANEKFLTAQIQMNLGFAFVRRGNPISGLVKVKNSFQFWQEIGDARGQATAGVGLGFVYSVMNEKKTALYYYRQAAEMFPEDMDWLEKAKSFNGIATIYEEYGDVKIAEDYRTKALEFYDKSHYLYGKLATLPSLAELKCLSGDRVSGKKLYDEALILARQLNDSFHQAIVKEGLGNLDFEDGSYDDAIENYQAAAKTYKSQNLTLPRVENSIGKAFERKKDFVLARKYFDSALETNRKIRDISQMAENSFNLAKLDAAEGKLENSLEQITESLKITDFLYTEVGNNKLKSNYISSVFNRYELAVNLLMKMHRRFPDQGFDARALQASEKSRARSMLEKLSLSEANFNKDANPETIRREKEIRNLLSFKADELTDALSSKLEKTEIDKISDETNELTDELEQIEADLKQNSPLYSAIKNPQPFDTTDFQNRVLDDETLLLEFSFGTDESFLWLIGKNQIESRVLPARAQIESHVETLRRLIDSRRIIEGETPGNYQSRIAVAEEDFEREAQIFSNELLGQVTDKIRGKRLLIVPDGKLHYFPLAALPFPNSIENQPILLTNETIYQPSAAMLALLTQINKTSAATKNLLVFSDPIFSREDERISGAASENQIANFKKTENFRFAESLNNLPRLAASRDEADSITEIVGASARLFLQARRQCGKKLWKLRLPITKLSISRHTV